MYEQKKKLPQALYILWNDDLYAIL